MENAMFKRVIITSGPTQEPIDPVRYITNRSSGKTGFHLANEAQNRQIDEILFITGPSSFKPIGVNTIPVQTAMEMRSHLQKFHKTADVIIMSAAVSDYRVANVAEKKIKKNYERLMLELVKNPDLLMELGQNKPSNQILVGFAAETHNILENAMNKFKKKNLDLLVLNEISPLNPAFDVDENQVHFVTHDGIRTLKRMSKVDIAVHIWDQIEALAK
jgi:phosphopantothenoylcysteine decarboxylase / phosphopantothenate---cysteine ligase